MDKNTLVKEMTEMKTITKPPTNFDYSRMNLYKKCPQSYKWQYKDCRTPKTPPNMYYAFPGIVIQKIFELFYNNEWYRKGKECRPFIYTKAAEIFSDVLRYTKVDWESEIAKKTKQQVYEEILEMIGRNLDVFKEQKLLGEVSKSEYKIQSYFGDNKYVILNSKVDFLIESKTRGVQILDGKATSNKADYVKNPTQLFFYAMMYKLKSGRYPDKVGYWFWRTGEVVYIDFDDTVIENLKVEIKDILYKIYKEKFDPTPSFSNCIFCNYKEECLDRKKDAAIKQAEKSIEITEEDLNLF